MILFIVECRVMEICAKRALHEFQIFYRVNFQPHHADMDFALRIRRMFGNVTVA